jgi:hypothetical protein
MPFLGTAKLITPVGFDVNKEKKEKIFLWNENFTNFATSKTEKSS